MKPDEKDFRKAAGESFDGEKIIGEGVASGGAGNGKF